MMTHCYRFADASVIAAFDYVSMIWAAALGYLVFAETPTPSVLIGLGRRGRGGDRASVARASGAAESGLRGEPRQSLKSERIPFDIPDEFGYDRRGSCERGRRMGVEGKDRAKVLEAGAAALSNQLGLAVQRLRKSYGLSLAELSAQSGVAKSIISQIERNETNPTLTTIWRLAHALDVSIESILQGAEEGPFIEHLSRGDDADFRFR